MGEKNGSKTSARSARAAGSMQTRTFYPPPDCQRFAREFVMRELNGLDDIELGIWLEAAIEDNPLIMESGVALQRAERHEAMRRALVSVDGSPVNVHGVPYKEFDRWSKRMMQFVGTAFNKLNGIEMKEGKAFMAGEYGPGQTTATVTVNEASPEARTGENSAA